MFVIRYCIFRFKECFQFLHWWTFKFFIDEGSVAKCYYSLKSAGRACLILILTTDRCMQVSSFINSSFTLSYGAVNIQSPDT